MELRARIVEVGGPAYPSEPTTYYRPVQTGKMDNPWQLVEKQTTGGSGQQLEGAKLVKALRGTVGYQHRVFHTIMIETSAGARNDEIVALLNSWWGNGAGRRDAINEEHLEAAINRLDQSTLRADEYRSKVLGNLEITLAPTIYEKIEPLVTEYRAKAAAEACMKLREALFKSLYTIAWSRDMEHRDRKLRIAGSPSGV
jgi:hypothetical protein